MPTPHETFNALVYQTLEAAAALLEAGRPAEALHTIKILAEMELTARQREQYGVLRREIESQLVTDSWVALQFAHPEPLTFSLFFEGVMPYLQALNRLHEVVARLKGKSPAWDPEIRQMSHHSPFSITVGYWQPDIIRTILDVVFEERRGAARRLKAGKPPEQPLLTRVTATYTLLEKVLPEGANEAQKAALAHQLLPDVDLLASGPVEAQVIGVSVQPDERPALPSGWAVDVQAEETREAPEAPEAPEAMDTPEPEAPEPRSTAAKPSDEPRYIGGAPERYQPRRRVTRPAPKPFSPPTGEDEAADTDQE